MDSMDVDQCETIIRNYLVIFMDALGSMQPGDEISGGISAGSATYLTPPKRKS